MAGATTEGSKIVPNVTITTGDGMAFDIDCGARGWFHAKVSRYVNLREQFDAHRLAFQRFAAVVPEPVAHFNIDGIEILIARSVEFEPLSQCDLTTRRWQNRLIEFFELTRETAPSIDGRSNHIDTATALGTFFEKLDGPHSSRSQYVADTFRSLELASLVIPQHGDFSINNLGRYRGRLIVFDWEDYGAVDMAGFDICVLALSTIRMDPAHVAEIRAVARPKNKPWAIAKPACDAIGLAYVDFRRLLPLYLLLFRFLKRNYATGVRERTDRLVAALLD